MQGDPWRPVLADECASCHSLLSAREQADARPVCEPCDRRLDAELSAYLEFVRICREPSPAAA